MIRNCSINSLILLLVTAFILPCRLLAQVWSEDFNGAATPPGWVVLNDLNNYESADVYPELDDEGWVLTPRYDSWIDGDKHWVTTSLFEPADTADRWLISRSFTVTDSAMVLLWEDKAANIFKADKIEVWISPTAGTTRSSFTDLVHNSQAGDSTYYYVQHGIPLEDYYGQTIRVGFRDHTYNGWYVYVDNVATEIWNYRDAGVQSVNFPLIAAPGTYISTTIKNHGATVINSLKVRYSVDYIGEVDETITGLNILPLDSQNVVLSTPTTYTDGLHAIFVDILEVNGVPDVLTSNNSGVKSFTAASSSVARAGLIEDFGSSSCGPCASFNAILDPLTIANNANDGISDFNVIKYQLDWPGVDLSYNEEANARKMQYGIGSIPRYFYNGLPKPLSITTQADIDATKAAPAFLTISGSYSIEGDSLVADITLLPHFSMIGNFILHMAATQAHYTNLANTSGQEEYYDVMRDMFPDGNGTAITEFNDGVPLHFKYKKHYEVGTVTPGSHTFWSSPENGSLVVFVQSIDYWEVLQSRAFKIGGTNINAPGNAISSLSLYPNPTSGTAYLSLMLEQKTKVEISIYDMSGRKLVAVSNDILENGVQTIPIPAEQLNSGAYFVAITTPGGSIIRKLSVIK